MLYQWFFELRLRLNQIQNHRRELWTSNYHWGPHPWVWEDSCTGVWKSCLGLRIAFFVPTSGKMFWSTFGVCVRARVFFSPQTTFQHLSHLSQPLVDLIHIMYSEVPNSRPSASETFDCVRDLVLSHDILMSHVPQRASVVWRAT